MDVGEDQWRNWRGTGSVGSCTGAGGEGGPAKGGPAVTGPHFFTGPIRIIKRLCGQSVGSFRLVVSKMC